MRECPVHEYQSQIARELRDMIGIHQDFLRLLEFLKLLQDQNIEQIVAEAVFTASLITYRRCFQHHGARVGLPTLDVETLAEGASAYHKHWLDMANKFAAHSVNPFETVALGIALDGDEIVGVSEFSARLITITPKEAEQWTQFVKLIGAKIVKPKIEVLRTAMLDEAKTRPVRDIKRARNLGYTVPGPQAAGTKRT